MSITYRGVEIRQVIVEYDDIDGLIRLMLKEANPRDETDRAFIRECVWEKMRREAADAAGEEES